MYGVGVVIKKEEDFMVIGIIGIVVALVLFAFLVYKGFNVLYVAPICVLLVAITNEISPLTAFTATYVSGVTNTIVALFSIIFLGAIFGKVMQDTGASIAISNLFTKNFVFKTEKKESQILRAVISVVVMGGLLTYGGVDAYTQIFVMFPIIVTMVKKMDLPRKVIPSFLVLNVAFIAAPGSPQIYNIITQAAFGMSGYEGTKVTYGLIPGLIAVVIIAVGGIIFATYFSRKAVHGGEGFDWGRMEKFNLDENRKTPPLILALLPLVLVFVLYTILGLDIAIAISSAIVLALILMSGYIDKESEVKINRLGLIKRTLNHGADRFPQAVLQLTAPAGFAAIVTITAAFGLLVNAVASLDINPIILTLLALMILTAITSNPIAALMIALPLVLGILGARGEEVNVPAIFRVAALAATTFETLPFNGMPLLCNMLAGTTHKEAYKPIFMQTVLFTLVGSVVCALIFLVFPGIL